MSRQRVVSFIDGLNLYHAISAIQRPELKWIDLVTLSQVFVRPRSEELSQVFYFSAHAEHVSLVKQEAQKAHLRALELKGITPVLGHFKEKDRRCPSCHHKWVGHEEKETDVNIALFLLHLAYKNAFDRALVISNDSDLVPAIRMVRKFFPEKQVTSISPPNYYHSIELIEVSSNKSKIRIEHLERSILPPVVSDRSGLNWVSRPQEYFPPANVYART